MKPNYGLLEAFGVEVEYMIVDCETLAVRPIADRLLFETAGKMVADIERGALTWSNELVNHVIELSLTEPVSDLTGLDARFHEHVGAINEQLGRYGAMLLPTGAHPLMDPATDAQLWPHEFSEIYQTYDRIFGCQGHGWSNLQSTHLNLSFGNDEEFGRLHAAIRVLLPILPALSASTPLLDGQLTGWMDSRLEVYRLSQARIPSITGSVIPEAVFTEAGYHARIFEPMMNDVAPYDPEGYLEHYFLNSRGAIARFDRGAIEIRVLDVQECPAADLAILQTITAVLRLLVAERWAPLALLKQWHQDDLAAIFLDIIRYGDETLIRHPKYPVLFGLPSGSHAVRDLWRHLFREVRTALPQPAARSLEVLIEQGPLSRRILRRLAGDISDTPIQNVYHELAGCLQDNRMLT